jgi:hypothetical protein
VDSRVEPDDIVLVRTFYPRIVDSGRFASRPKGVIGLAA